MKTMETIKACGRIFASGYRVAKKADNVNEYILSLPAIKTMNIDGYEVKLSVDSDAIRATGLRFGMTHYYIKNNEMYFSIILEDECINLGSSLCQFIIHHEIGHLVNEVFGKYFIFNNRNLQNEMNADIYAARMIGAKKALEGLTILSCQEGIDRKEIKKRIQNMKMYMMANPNNR